MMRPFTGTGLEWNAIIARLPNAHLLQTWEWAQVKAAYGWKSMPFVWDSGSSDRMPVAAAMVLRRQVLSRGFAARLCILYIPKGPLFDAKDERLGEEVLSDLQVFAKKHGAMLLKIDPDVVLGIGVPGEPNARDDEQGQRLQSELRQRGWLFSGEQIQFRNTVMVDLTPSESELLTHMKQKTRYNVRLAEKKGLLIRAGSQSDLATLYRMYAETSVRDGFVVREERYYRTLWETFMRRIDA